MPAPYPASRPVRWRCAPAAVYSRHCSIPATEWGNGVPLGAELSGDRYRNVPEGLGQRGDTRRRLLGSLVRWTHPAMVGSDRGAEVQARCWCHRVKDLSVESERQPKGVPRVPFEVRCQHSVRGAIRDLCLVVVLVPMAVAKESPRAARWPVPPMWLRPPRYVQPMSRMWHARPKPEHL